MCLSPSSAWWTRSTSPSSHHWCAASRRQWRSFSFTRFAFEASACQNPPQQPPPLAHRRRHPGAGPQSRPGAGPRWWPTTCSSSSARWPASCTPWADHPHHAHRCGASTSSGVRSARLSSSPGGQRSHRAGLQLFGHPLAGCGGVLLTSWPTSGPGGCSALWASAWVSRTTRITARHRRRAEASHDPGRLQSLPAQRPVHRLMWGCFCRLACTGCAHPRKRAHGLLGPVHRAFVAFNAPWAYPLWDVKRYIVQWTDLTPCWLP